MSSNRLDGGGAGGNTGAEGGKSSGDWKPGGPIACRFVEGGGAGGWASLRFVISSFGGGAGGRGTSSITLMDTGGEGGAAGGPKTPFEWNDGR